MESPLDNLVTRITSGEKIRGIRVSQLNKLLPHLRNLQNLVGNAGIKDSVASQVLYYLRGDHIGDPDFLHTVVKGTPGSGRTTLAKILASIYSIIISGSNHVVYKTRADLALSRTTVKDAVYNARDGVLVIESDVSSSNTDIALTELSNYLPSREFVCIIVEDSTIPRFLTSDLVRDCFSWTYETSVTTRMYEKVFTSIVAHGGWTIEAIPERFFLNNSASFPSRARDLARMFVRCKIFATARGRSKIIREQDLKMGLALMQPPALANRELRLYN